MINMNPGIDNCTGNCSGWTSSGKFGNALQFDGVNDYVQISDSSSLKLSNEITIEFWINANTLDNYTQIIRKVNGYLIRLQPAGSC